MNRKRRVLAALRREGLSVRSVQHSHTNGLFLVSTLSVVTHSYIQTTRAHVQHHDNQRVLMTHQQHRRQFFRLQNCLDPPPQHTCKLSTLSTLRLSLIVIIWRNNKRNNNIINIIYTQTLTIIAIIRRNKRKKGTTKSLRHLLSDSEIRHKGNNALT